MAIQSFHSLVILMLVVTTATNANPYLQYNADGAEVCVDNSAFGNEEDCASKHAKIGQVDPSQIRKMEIYDDWKNGTITLKGEKLAISKGAITWPWPLDRKTEFSVLPGLLPHSTINQVLKLLDKEKNPKATEFDTALDTVDAMPTREIYLHEGDRLGGGKEEKGQNKKRRKLRLKLKKILGKVEAKITAVIRKTWPEVCNRSPKRRCRPCFSLVRRYLPNERTTHNIHRDGQALVTAVVGLSDYGKDFLGGLYVAANKMARQVIPLRKGDVVMHQYDLLHGVQVNDLSDDEPATRWSWIMWYKDSSTCEQLGHRWSESCAEEGDPLCQYFHGWRIHLNPDLSQRDQIELREKWMTKSAEQGFGEAAFKVGRSHFGHRNLTGAVWWLHQAHDAGEADASYQLGHILLKGMIEPTCIAPGETKREAVEREALGLFEQAAIIGASPFGGSQFAMYNIGIARLFGFAGLERDPAVAARWFKACRLPEGYMAYSMFLNSVGMKDKSEEVKDQAKRQGFPRNPNIRDQALFSLHGDWPKGPPLW